MSKYPPTAELRKEGAMFTGKLLSKRVQDLGYGDRDIYMFEAVDAECEFKNGGTVVEAPAINDKVEVIAGTKVIKEGMSGAVIGKIYKITCSGKGKAAEGKQAPWLHAVTEVK